MFPSEQDVFLSNSPLKILIVEHVKSDLRVLQQMLSSPIIEPLLPPFITRTADTASHALSIYRSYRPDCVLLSDRLSDMSGEEFVKILLSSEGELTSAFVMMASSSDTNIALKSLQLGVHDYLVKGEVTAEKLGWTIESAVERLCLHQQIKEKQEELELFARRAAHDMVSPLTNLSLYVESMQEQIEESTYQESPDTFNSILSIVEHMTGLIDGLSTYAQVGRDAVSFDVVNLQELFEYTIFLIKSEVTQADANLDVGSLPAVVGNRSGLAQLFQNLLSNALKYRSERALQIEIGAKESGNAWHIWVKDNGIGIDSMYHSEVFSPFRRLHSRVEYAGCGLGLATCKKIVNQHGGHIWLESVLGQGTTVHIVLPVTVPYHRLLRLAGAGDRAGNSRNDVSTNFPEDHSKMAQTLHQNSDRNPATLNSIIQASLESTLDGVYL